MLETNFLKWLSWDKEEEIFSSPGRNLTGPIHCFDSFTWKNTVTSISHTGKTHFTTRGQNSHDEAYLHLHKHFVFCCAFEIAKQRKTAVSGHDAKQFLTMLLSTEHVRKCLLKLVPLHFQNAITACTFAHS